MPSHTGKERKKKKRRQAAVSRKVSKLRGEGKSHDQAVAQAINTVKKRGPKGATFA